jgi:cytoskeletal protein RodZ
MDTRKLLINWAAFGIAIIALFVGWNYQTNRTLDKLHAIAQPAPSVAADPAVTAANAALAEARVLQAKATTELTLAQTTLAQAQAEAQRAYTKTVAKPEPKVSAAPKPVAPPAYYAPSGGGPTAPTWDSGYNRPYAGLKASWQSYDKSKDGRVGKKLKPGLYPLPYGSVRVCEKGARCAPSS